MRILNYTGANVRLYENAEYDVAHNCYIEGEDGRPYVEFPSRGCLEAHSEAPTNGFDRSLDCKGVNVPVQLYPKWVDVDALPIGDEDDFTLVIVTEEYVRACECLGIPTTKLLTVGSAVVDEENWITVLGHVNLVWHTFSPEPETEENSANHPVTIRNLTPDDITIYYGATYDSAIKKYRGGMKALVFAAEEHSAIRLVVETTDRSTNLIIDASNAVLEPENEGNPFSVSVSVEPTYAGIQSQDGSNWDPEIVAGTGQYFIVTDDCIRECYRRGIDTSHLITVGSPVVDVDGHTVIGYTHLVWH